VVETLTYWESEKGGAMGTVAQTVLPFKVEATEELLTANAGLALFGEFARGVGLARWLEREMPRPGSGRGYAAGAYVVPLVLMLTGGGRSLEDLRTLRNDVALARLLGQGAVPSSDAVGDWLRRTGAGTGLAGLDRINRRLVAAVLRGAGATEHTLDADATQIVAEKESAKITYQGEQGYMPMVGHLAETGVVVHEEFREGNVAPATRNLEFLRACEARLPAGHRIAHVRMDAAGYQAEVFNHCEEYGQTFAIGGRLDAAAQAVVAALPESAWTHYPDCAVAETTHSMKETTKAFRLIVVKYPRQAQLFGAEAPRVHLIASNRRESTEATLLWYRQRGETSENGIKELKIGFGLERMPCGQFAANAAFFRIGAIAHNLFVLFKRSALGEGWQRHRVATVRWRLLHLPGKLVRHAGAWVLKVAAGAVEQFRTIRAASLALARALSP
jgi:hypothetical protein